jgi:hypothetical protein
MNYNGKSDEKITRTYTKINDENFGIYIQTNYDTYKFCISKFQSCCEGFGVDLINNDNQVIFNIYSSESTRPKEEDYTLLKGFSLKKIEYCHERSVRPEDELGKYNLSLEMTLEDNKLNEIVYYIDIFNWHNGYYPHGYFVEWNNYKNGGEL